MKKVLVTGGAGFIGSSTIQTLLDTTNAVVVCVDNFDDTYEREYKEDNIAEFQSNERFTLYESDITHRKNLMEIFAAEEPTHVLHLAAKADTRKAVEDPYSYVGNNIVGTLNVLEASVAAQVTQVVAASSSSVYGNDERLPWRESDTDIHPISPYGVTKLSTEHLAYTYYKNHNLPVTMLRYFNAYGEKNRPGMVPYKWAEAMLTDKKIEISGDGSRRRDYTYIGDIAAGTIAALSKPLGFEVINLGHGSPLSLTDLLTLFETVTGEKAEVTSRPSHPASVEETYADTTKALELLDWKPTVSHEEGIKRLVEWFKTHRLKK